MSEDFRALLQALERLFRCLVVLVGVGIMAVMLLFVFVGFLLGSM